MDSNRFDHLTRIVATRRRGLATLLGAAAVGISTPAANAKRRKTRCKYEVCRGECCKRGESCTAMGCNGFQNYQQCVSDPRFPTTCSQASDCQGYGIADDSGTDLLCNGNRCYACSGMNIA